MGCKSFWFSHLIFQALLLFSSNLFHEARAQAKIPDSEFMNSQVLDNYEALLDPIKISDLRLSIQKIWIHGLDPSWYWTDELEALFQKAPEGSASLKKKVQQRFIIMLQHLSDGSVDPAILGIDIKLKKKKFIDYAHFSRVLLEAGNDPEKIMNELAPKSPPYLELQRVLQKIYPACLSGEWQEITKSNKNLQWNEQDELILQIKKRLILLGYPILTMDDNFDDSVLGAISSIQSDLQWQPDGKMISRGRTWKFFKTKCLDRVRQVQADMEKLRWFATPFEEKFVFLNLSASQFIFFDMKNESKVKMTFKIINGRPSRKSPTMRDEIVRIILNPFWVVPKKIFFEDKVPEIRMFSGENIRNYFSTNHYEIWNSRFTKRMNPELVNWSKYVNPMIPPDIYIRQLPHRKNALGSVKFEMTNTFSVYLHDTNQPDLFENPARQQSSGCIRLEKPFLLVNKLLQGTAWDQAAIQNILAAPDEVLSKSTVVELDRPLPVYMAFVTSMMGDDGIIHFYPDTYKHNHIILKSMKAVFAH